MRAHEENRPIPDQRIKTGPFLVQWLEEVARPTIRASTHKSYREIVERHLVPGLGRIPLAKLTPADVQSFLNRKLESGLSPRRVEYMHAVLRRALVIAERWGMVTRNAPSSSTRRGCRGTRSARSRPSRLVASSTPRPTIATGRST
jgi:integrase